jgi:dihydrolipoamide dehydrogenase
MPRCTYCHPHFASFGMSERQAAEQGHVVRVGRFPLLANGKAVALGERDGSAKTVADAVPGEILGAHLVGPEVTKPLPELVLARG